MEHKCSHHLKLGKGEGKEEQIGFCKKEKRGELQKDKIQQSALRKRRKCSHERTKGNTAKSIRENRDEITPKHNHFGYLVCLSWHVYDFKLKPKY